MTSYASFFGASASTAGALTGLLFVALSVSPERLRDEESLEHQAIAATAFTALIDALFVSLAGLTPGGGTKGASLALGLLGVTSTVALARRLWRARSDQQLSLRWPFLLVSISAVYVAQVVLALVPESVATQDSVTESFIFAMFAVGIARSWELLGLSGGGLLDLLTARLSVRPEASQPARPDDDPR